MGEPAKALDERGRCCGRKPIEYRREPHKFCPRCDRAFDSVTGEQIGNWAYTRDADGTFTPKYPKPPEAP